MPSAPRGGFPTPRLIGDLAANTVDANSEDIMALLDTIKGMFGKGGSATRDAGDRAAIRSLAEGADVLLCSWRPGTSAQRRAPDLGAATGG